MIAKQFTLAELLLGPFIGPISIPTSEQSTYPDEQGLVSPQRSEKDCLGSLHTRSFSAEAEKCRHQEQKHLLLRRVLVF